MRSVMISDELTRDRVFRFPTSQIMIGSNKSSYFDVISSKVFPECNEALLRIFPKIDLPAIDLIIDETGMISDIHKAFYKHMIHARYDLILKDTYEGMIR